MHGKLRRDDRRWIKNDAGRFDYREVSAFSLYSLWLQGRTAEIDAFLASVAPYATVLRVILTLDGWRWASDGYRCGPDVPGFYEQFATFVNYVGSKGFYLRVCFIGGPEQFGRAGDAERRDVWDDETQRRAIEMITRLVTACRGHVVIGVWEIVNEPAQVGMRESFHYVRALGELVKQLDPDTLMNFAAVDGPNEGLLDFAVAPADIVDTHIWRKKELHGFLWVKRSSEHPVLDQKELIALSGEPINLGETGVSGPGDVERSPAVAFAYGVVSRLRRYVTNFHSDNGLWCKPPAPETVECLKAWKAGLDQIPMLDGPVHEGWCNAQMDCSPWLSSAVPTKETDNDHFPGPNRIFGLTGGFGYIGASVKEPEHWDYQQHVKPGRTVTRVARVVYEGWGCSVYQG